MMAEAKAWVMIPKLDKDKTSVIFGMVPLVLCKDCVKRGFDDCPVYGWKPELAEGDWFCADGVMKDD